MMANERRNPDVRLSDDRIPLYIFVVIFVGVLVVLGGIGWSWILYVDRATEFGGFPAPISIERAPRTISGVNQTLILYDRHGQRLREEQLRRLESFGWVDRRTGIVHVPIDDAIDWMVEEER